MKKNGMRSILTFLVTGIFCACDDAQAPENFTLTLDAKSGYSALQTKTYLIIK